MAGQLADSGHGFSWVGVWVVHSEVIFRVLHFVKKCVVMSMRHHSRVRI